ncbi:MAG TPA: diguanylate cyclase [Burkholderiales bacterium]
MEPPQKPLEDESDEPAYRTELKMALAELGRARAALRWMEQRHFVLVEAMEEGIVMLDENGQVTTMNPTARVLIGDGDAVVHWLWGANAAQRVQGLHPATETLLDGRPRTGIEMQVTGPDGRMRWLNVNARAVFDMDTRQVAAVLCSFSDISSHKHLELELERQATRDPLTGLYNRRYIERRLREELERARRSGEPLSVVVLDLDHFKNVNDRHGHVTGDRVLKRFADMLTLCLRNHDLVGRIGGDEFCVILPGATGDSAQEVVARCLREVAAVKVDREGRLPAISGTAGVAQFGDELSPQQLIEKADQALYAAKTAGRGRALLFQA